MNLRRLIPVLTCLLLLPQTGGALPQIGRSHPIKKNPVATAIITANPAFDLESLLTLEIKAAEAFVIYKAATQKLSQAQARVDNEKIIAPIMDQMLKNKASKNKASKSKTTEKIKSAFKRFFEIKNPKSQTTTATSWPTSVDPQIAETAQAAQAAYNLASQNLEHALTLASASTEDTLFVQVIRYSKNFRENVGQSLHSTLFKDDPDCAGDIIGDSLIAKYAFRATQAALETNVNAVNSKRAEAIAHLTRYTQQLMCIGAAHLALVDHALAQALEGTTDTLLDALLNPVLVTFNESKFLGSKLFDVLVSRAPAIKQSNETGKITGGIGVWVRNFSTGRLQQSNFSESPIGNDNPFGNIQYQLGQMGMPGFSAFGVPFDKLTETCSITTIGAAPMGGMETPSWGEAVDIFTDPMQMGTGSQSLIDSAFQNLPDTQGSCGGGAGGGGGESETNKAIACAMSAMSNFAEEARTCKPGQSPLKPMIGNATPTDSGNASMGQGGGSPLCATMGTGCSQSGGEFKPTDIVYKSSLNCQGGSAVAGENPGDSTPSSTRRYPMPDRPPTADEKEQKFSDAKDSAQEMVDDNADYVFDKYEEMTGKSVPQETRDEVKQTAFDKIETAELAPLPANVAGSTGEKHNDIKVNSNLYFTEKEKGLAANDALDITLAHEGMHVLLNELNRAMGTSMTEKQDHSIIEKGLDWICDESSSNCATSCTGQEISANSYMSCTKDANLPHTPSAANECKTDAECIGPQDSADPSKNISGNLGTTPDGPSAPPDNGIICNMGDKAINLIDYIGIIDPSPLMPFDTSLHQNNVMAPMQDIHLNVAPSTSKTFQDKKINLSPPEMEP